MEGNWTEEQMSMAQKIVMERFAMNCVAGHLAPLTMLSDTETTVRRNRFDFHTEIVNDREVLDLYEPFSLCKLTKAQVDEFCTIKNTEDLMLTKAVTTLTRAASRLARWHDVLFFRGLRDGLGLKPPLVEMLIFEHNLPQSLREAAIEAEEHEHSHPVRVNSPINEGLVAAIYEAVELLETRGYYTAYHLVLGEVLWRELHRPTHGSMVLPRDRVEFLMASKNSFYRTTTLPENEALLVSLDGPTFDCVIAGDPAMHPHFEFLSIRPQPNHEELFVCRARERWAPRVRENRAVVRLLHHNEEQRESG